MRAQNKGRKRSSGWVLQAGPPAYAPTTRHYTSLTQCRAHLPDSKFEAIMRVGRFLQLDVCASRCTIAVLIADSSRSASACCKQFGRILSCQFRKWCKLASLESEAKAGVKLNSCLHSVMASKMHSDIFVFGVPNRDS